MSTANAAEHFVPTTTASVDCTTYGGGIKPGDILTLRAGDRGPLRIMNCAGSDTKPIIVRNDKEGTGPTVIQYSSTDRSSFAFEVRNVRHFVLDGTQGWNGKRAAAYCGAPTGHNGCGIKITATSKDVAPTSFLRVTGVSTNFTIRGIEIDGKYEVGASRPDRAGIGIHVRDQSITEANYPGFWRENVLIERNYVHNTFGEGMYLGPNWRDNLEVPSRNWEIRYNLTQDTGRQGIQLKRATEGYNWIHHNVVKRSGIWHGETIAGEKHGISCFESTCVASHNFVVESGEAGISMRLRNMPRSLGVKSFDAFNNIVVNAGVRPMTPGHGIVSGSASTAPDVRTKIYNNTIVNSVDVGIKAGSVVNGEIRDNIAVGSGSSDILASGDVAVFANQTGGVFTQRFNGTSALDFRLTDDSPGRNNGSRGGFPEDDFDGSSRRDVERISQGAFEWVLARPNAPILQDVK